ncbi:MAG: hypothetical protein DMG88_19090 [Acidobacteria bacterium]|nr:MAG: hypothetical protein DMG88_19090 [Acidobacteriota bacterium]
MLLRSGGQLQKAVRVGLKPSLDTNPDFSASCVLQRARARTLAPTSKKQIPRRLKAASEWQN